ncbi:MAG: tRNA (N6-threonylcarbamoyladenosine(37)-N6)-methyltransferase TrmO [Deltaproteobacteria bacterium]|nr:MAG: tRNA (N6-threonylcarbamoyladenosine(37)-N6)-methyltransferase TrmO [Deltaproteobacteria bacterium]
MSVTMKYIGFVRTESTRVPRHWSLSDVEGSLVIDEAYTEGLKDIRPGQRIVVIFHFHRGVNFGPEFLTQTPPNRQERIGVFSTCSPIRPNPVGMSVLEVTGVEANIVHVKGLDMLDGTPILDIKPYVEDKYSCPSFEGRRRHST